uniref:PH domain-containing protein n=1 Tax=Brugia timori TaxID=42155 RepID=A0A0R3R0M1_9BILA
LDALPSNATMLAKSPPSRFGSTLSLDMVDQSPAKPLNSFASLFDASHHEIVETEVKNGSKTYSSSSVTQSEPIAIPQSNASVIQVVTPLVEEENSVKPKSDKSSQFGTPEDHTSYQQRQLMYLKQDFVLTGNQTKEYSDEALKRINNSLITFVGYRNIVPVSDQASKPVCKDVATETETGLKLEFSMDDADELSGKDVLVFELRQVIELQKKEISRLREQQLNAENTVAKMEIERNQMYKTLIADHELALERKFSSHSEEIKRKNEEIDSLKATLHKLHESVVYHVENAAGTIANDETEEKYTTAYENSLLDRVPVEMKESCSVASKLIDSQDDGAVSVLNDLSSKGYPLKSFTSWYDFSEIFAPIMYLKICKSKLMLIIPAAINMTQSSKVKIEERDSERNENTDDDLRADSDEDIAPVTVRPATAQTVISLREMRTMITVQDIHEYCAVLIVWSEPHNAYILFRLVFLYQFY